MCEREVWEGCVRVWEGTYILYSIFVILIIFRDVSGGDVCWVVRWGAWGSRFVFFCEFYNI